MSEPSERPAFPITVRFHDDGSVETFDDEAQLLSGLEWFAPEGASVTDALGRGVWLRVAAMEFVVFQVATGQPPSELHPLEFEAPAVSWKAVALAVLIALILAILATGAALL